MMWQVNQRSCVMSAVLLAWICVWGCAARADNRACAINLEVKNAAGQPVTGLLVNCRRRVAPSEGVAGLAEVGCSVTDANGRVAWSASIPEGPAKIYVSITQRCDAVDASQYDLVGQAYQAAITASHFDAHYPVEIAAGATSVDFTVTGTLPVKVRARAPQSGETGWLITIRETRTPPPLLSQFEKVEGVALGVERGHAALITVRGGLSPGVRLFSLTSDQTRGDVDLGVVERTPEGAHPCTIRVLDRRAAVRSPEVTIPSVTVFSEDGAKAWTYDVFGSGRVGHTNGISPSLDPGRYAIVPGRIDGNELPARVLGEIRRTGGIPAGIPVLNVTAAGPNTLEVSLAPVIDIGMAFPAFP